MTENAALLALLEVQAHDTRLDQLHHLHETLPARQERDGASRSLSETEVALQARTSARDELARQQKRVDDEVESLKEKRAGFDAKLYSGTVTNPRELQDLQEEIESLGRRISVLEDEEIAIMEQVEPVEAEVAELDRTLVEQRAALDAAEAHLIVAEAEVLADLEAEQALRATAIVPVPQELLAEYEKLRGGRGGVGVARLTGTQCGGCHLTLSAMEASRMRKLPDGEVGHCEECGRILVP